MIQRVHPWPDPNPPKPGDPLPKAEFEDLVAEMVDAPDDADPYRGVSMPEDDPPQVCVQCGQAIRRHEQTCVNYMALGPYGRANRSQFCRKVNPIARFMQTEQEKEDMSQHEHFHTWAIVELMGHRVMAGFVEEVQIAGTGMIRIDVPATEGIPAFSKILSTQAIYGIVPTDEDTAKMQAQEVRSRPIEHFSFAQAARLALTQAEEYAAINADFEEKPPAGKDDVPF